MNSIYKLADQIIEISSLWPDVHSLCLDYQTIGTPVFSVIISQTDIDFERAKSIREDTFEGIPVRQFSDSYLETLAVYRKIAERMPMYDTILFHGSCVSIDGVGYLFSAKSGTGKSTHAHLWRELLGNRAVMVNDDKPLIRINANGVTACGTPWDGKHRLSNNISVPLHALCVLERASENRIEPIPVKDAYHILLQQVYRPSDTKMMAKTLLLVDKLAESVRLFRLRCNMDLDAARLAYETMRG